MIVSPNSLPFSPCRVLAFAAACALLVCSSGCDLESLVAAAKGQTKDPMAGAGSGELASLDASDGAAAADSNSLGPDSARRLYYQFVDQRGNVRFVERLDDVPSRWRAQVGFVEMDGPPPGSPADAKRQRNARYASRGVGLQVRGSVAASSVNVLLYSADWCGWCKKAKAYLQEKRIPYEERDVDNPAAMAELVRKTGQRGIPVFDVGGRILTGFDPAGLDRLLRDAA